MILLIAVVQPDGFLYPRSGPSGHRTSDNMMEKLVNIFVDFIYSEHFWNVCCCVLFSFVDRSRKTFFFFFSFFSFFPKHQLQSD